MSSIPSMLFAILRIMKLNHPITFKKILPKLYFSLKVIERCFVQEFFKTWNIFPAEMRMDKWLIGQLFVRILDTFSFHPNHFHRIGRFCHHRHKRCKWKNSGTKGSKYTKRFSIENQHINREAKCKHDGHQEIPPFVMSQCKGDRAQEPWTELREDDISNQPLSDDPIDDVVIFKFRDINIWGIGSIVFLEWQDVGGFKKKKKRTGTVKV